MDQDPRLGSFDAATTRAYLAALRSIAGAVEELEPEQIQEEVDRTALLGEIRSTVYRLELEQPNVRNPGFWLSHLFQWLYALLVRSEADAAGRASAVVSRLGATPGFLDTARETIDEPPTVFVDTALGMLGGGGELIVQMVGVFGQAAPGPGGSAEEGRRGCAQGAARLRRRSAG